MQCQQSSDQDGIRYPRKQQDHSIKSYWPLGKVVLTHPRSYKRNQRQPKEKVKICPEDFPVDKLRCMDQMVMVRPVDSQKDEAERVANKNRNQRPKALQSCLVRRPKFEHHDRYQDCDNTVAEGFKS